jgi:hypothetical protein
MRNASRGKRSDGWRVKRKAVKKFFMRLSGALTFLKKTPKIFVRWSLIFYLTGHARVCGMATWCW